MNKPLVTLKDIQLILDSFKLSLDFLDLYPGEIHAVMGENGSGKSLVMQVVNGTLQPAQGTLEFDQTISRPTRYKASKDILYVSQELELMESLTVAENLYFHHMPVKRFFANAIDHELMKYQSAKIFEKLGLTMDVNEPVSSLGLAQRQIIAFCKAYISEAKIVILDEPSGALTQMERAILYRIVDSIKRKGVGVFYITHNLEDVLTIANRVSIMKKGKLIGTKTVSETTEEEIIKLMSGNYVKGRYPRIKASKGKTILSVRHLGFENKLKDVSFDLREGEILGITGLAGSGRSLLASCLFGDARYTGEIIISQHLKDICSPRQAIKNGIALVPENRKDDSIFRTLDITENIALPSFKRFAKNLVLDYHYLRESVEEYLERMNIPSSDGTKFHSYSGSNIQKALFAKWIMNRAKIFILDEPTRGVDIPTKIDIYNFINDLVRNKVAIIFISSDIEEIFGICDRVAVLSDNTMVCDKPTSDTTVEEVVKLAAFDRK